MSQKAPFTPRRRRKDLVTLGIAAALLIAVGLWWTSLSHEAVKRKQEIVSRVPAFPERGQVAREPRAPRPILPPVIAVAAESPDGGVPPRAPELTAANAVKQFILNADPKGLVMTMQFNSLMNAPIIEKLDKCFPKDEIRREGADAGVDFTRDIDQIAATDDGTMFTGFFDEEGARNVAGCHGSKRETRTYRGFTISQCNEFGGMVAVRPSMALRTHEDIAPERLIDQMLNAPPAGANADDVYGDIYMRLGTEMEKQLNPKADAIDRVLSAIFTQSSSLTFRANVWDSVALSLDAQPREGQSVEDLSSTLNGALSLARRSIDPEDVELSAYADLAKVGVNEGQLQAHLALPTEKLIEQMNSICEREKAEREAAEDKDEHEDEADQAQTGEAAEEAEAEGE